ncbi:hypothetical protein QZH41_017643, partial [Actinostola sp. cb2023]
MRSPARLTIALVFLLDICWFVSEVHSEPLQGSLARCSDDSDVVDLPILAGNPCISCRCQNGDEWYEPGCRVCRCHNTTIICERQQCAVNLKCSKIIRPIQTELVRYGSIQTELVRYGSIQTELVRYGSIQTELVRYGSIQTELVRYGSIGPNWCVSIQTELVRYGSIQTELVRYGSIQTELVRYGSIQTWCVTGLSRYPDRSARVLNQALYQDPAAFDVLKTTRRRRQMGKKKGM